MCLELSTSCSPINTEEISRLQKEKLYLEGKRRRQRNGDGIQTVANSGALGKSQKANAQSGLVGLVDKHAVAHFQVPSALASVATRLDRVGQVPQLSTCLLKCHPQACQLGEPSRHRQAENSQDN